jgi:hypothetical protein
MCDLRYLCLFTHGGVQHILCCVFVLFVFTLCLVYQMYRTTKLIALQDVLGTAKVQVGQ